MSETKTVEHHWHEPTTGQVYRAIYQYLTDNGVTESHLNAVISKKIETCVREKIENAFKPGSYFDKIVVDAIAKCIASEKQYYSTSSYRYTDHILSLVRQQIQQQLLSDYEITIKKKESQ